jgi:hypothetical protein
MHRILISIPILALLVSCSLSHRHNDEKPIARAYGNYLYPSDIKDMIPPGTTREDSLEMIKSHIELWLKKKALVNKAEFNLTATQKDLEQKIQEYRTTLLIYEYEKLMVAQQLDTLVTDAQVSTYYSQYRQNFQLQVPIVKGVYFRLPKTAARIREFRELARTSGDAAYARLTDIAAQSADYTESFEETWLSFNSLMQKIPGSVQDPQQFLQRYKYLEAEDERFYHYVKISDYKLPGETAPLEYVKQEITDILLNKRKIDFLKELEESIYNEAVISNEVEVYQN